MNAPEITVAHDMDTDLWTLYCTSYGQTQPAGDRLIHPGRDGRWPDIRYEHALEADAQKHAAMLREHIAGWGKSASKAKVRAMGAD